MFEHVDVSGDDAAACAAGLMGSLVERRMAAASRFAWVARWAHLHEPELMSRQDRMPVEARRKEVWQVATDGIPAVTVASVLELGVLLQLSPRSAECLVRDVLEVEHRLPRTWHAVMTGDVEDWQARQVAKATRHLPQEQAMWVDAELGDALTTLPWGRAMAVVEAKVIAADPARHAARLEEEDGRQFVSTRRRSNVHGLRTVIARGPAGAIARVEAMVSHLASVMEATGDGDSTDVRRFQAFALLAANPAMACAVLAGVSPEQTDPSPEQTGLRDVSADERILPEAPAPSTAVELAREVGRVLRELGSLETLRPRSVLYVHISEAAVEGVRAAQVARVEDAVAAGPISIDQLRVWLGNDRVTVRPVIDPAESAAVDAYEIPSRLREAQALLTPFEIWPWGTCPARQADQDHTRPFVPVDRGGPPAQTAIGNLGPLGRRQHRAKTFAGFTVHQPVPGLYYWRTPTGWWYQVDHRGTRPLGRGAPAAVASPIAELHPGALSGPEQQLHQSILMHLAS